MESIQQIILITVMFILFSVIRLQRERGVYPETERMLEKEGLG